MPFGHAVVSLLGEDVGELLLLGVASHRYDAFDLDRCSMNEWMNAGKSHTHCAVALLDRQPVLADEVGLLHRLQITNDDVFEKPRGRPSLARVVMPHTNVVQ